MKRLRSSIVFKGMAMGAADVVPGVSGGTVAFMTGIYEELIEALQSLTPGALLVLKREGFSAFWAHIHGSFLLPLGCGIVASILSLARLIREALDAQPQLVWAFFFGLISVSAVVIGKKIGKWRRGEVATLVVGIVLAYWVTGMTPMEAEVTSARVLLAGLLASCALILPGISGSFILLALGMYGPILGAVTTFDMGVLGLFVGGCIVGLVTMSHGLAWLFRHYHSLTLALMTGFMVGSLNKLWPWKTSVSQHLNSHDPAVSFAQENILPYQYQYLTGQDPQIGGVILLILFAVALVWVLDRQSR